MGEVSQTHNDFEGVCRTLLLADQNSPTCDDSLVVGCRLFEHSVLSVLTTLPGNRDPSRSKMPCCSLDKDQASYSWRLSSVHMRCLIQRKDMSIRGSCHLFVKRCSHFVTIPGQPLRVWSRV